jgi:tRNA modification GTPase
MNAYNADIIVALATAPGVGAIAVIRLSGQGSIEMVNAFFKGKNLNKQASHTAHFGRIVDESGATLDECLLTIFRTPASYTREDTVEISCHGSPFIIEQLTQLFLRNGARSAQRGEFTMRAFLNGQLDLSQAEAVADLIASDSAASHSMAIKQMRGGFSDEIRELRSQLIDFCALIELELDFGEEDVEFANRTDLKNLIQKIITVVHRLIESFAYGNVIKSGINTAIVGRPNAGKSTLLNALLNEERAIVSSIAGTTRDTIQETMTIHGVIFRFIDTAGIRSTEDEIEAIGVQKSMETIAQADVILYIIDILETTPEQLWMEIKAIESRSPLFVILNKMDLDPYTDPKSYYHDGLLDEQNVITTSARNLMNIEYLKNTIYRAVIKQEITDDTIVNNSRHYDALYRTHDALSQALIGLNSNITGDFVAMDLRQALYHLGTIVGEVSTDDLLDSIFSRFCIGK